MARGIPLACKCIMLKTFGILLVLAPALWLAWQMLVFRP
jgi:hypothetical protein